MKEITKYECEQCNFTTYNKQEMLNHEKLHSVCVCQRGLSSAELAFRKSLGYGESIGSYFDFRRKAWVFWHNADNYHNHFEREQLIHVDYCPFCGRDLSEEEDELNFNEEIDNEYTNDFDRGLACQVED